MAVTWKKLAYEDDVITKALLTAKGSIIYASAASTPAELAIGTDNYVLTVATDVPAWEAASVVAHTLDNHNAATGAVPFGGQEAEDMVIDNESTAPTAVKGKVYYDTDDDSVYICTSAV